MENRFKPDIPYTIGKLLFNIPMQALLAAFMLLGAALLPSSAAVICIIASLFAGYEVILSAAKALLRKRFLHPDFFVLLSCTGTFLLGYPMEGAVGMVVYASCRSILEAEEEDRRNSESYSDRLSGYRESSEAYINLTENEPAPIERITRQGSLLFSLVSVFCILILTILVPMFWRLTYRIWLRRAFILLAAACPGALAFCTSTEFDRCIHGSAAGGIFYKSRSAIQKAAGVTSLVFSQLRSAPEGWHLVNCIPQGITKSQLLLLAAYACSHSNDLYADIIRREAGITIEEERIEGHSVLEHLGSAVIMDGRKIAAGTMELMKALHIDPPEIHTTASVLHIAADGQYAGCLLFSEAVRPVEAEAIEELTEMGIDRIVLLSTEDRTLVEKNARSLGIQEVFAGLTPEEANERMVHLQQMQLTGEALAYVNDGYSASDLMAKADLRISVGSDPHLSRSDVILPEEDYRVIAAALRNCRYTMAAVRRNLIIACSFKILILIAAIAGLGGLWLAVLLDTLASLFLIPGTLSYRLISGQNTK